MSESYERMNYITSFGFSIRWRRQFIDVFKNSNEKLEIIDLLSGMGETWHFIHKKFPNSHLSALDFSEGMINYATQKNYKKFNNRVNIIQQNALNNSLETGFYDYVFCGFGLKTFNDDQLNVFAKEIKRILKPGGKLSFVDVSEPKPFILKILYKFYLQKVIPVLGKLFLGNPEEYRMLWRYTDNFKNAGKASEIFKQNGLNVEFKEYFYGCASGFYGTKL